MTIAQDAVNKVMADSGLLFREGLQAYEDKKLSDAGEKFNKSVEVFLYSKLNIQRDAKIQGCYNQLIETIYRIEFPSESQLPQIRGLTQTCGWTNIDPAEADKITALARNSIVKVAAVPDRAKPDVSFNTQEFEPSPLDELSKLELTPDEQEQSPPRIYRRPSTACGITKPPLLRGLMLGQSPVQVAGIIGQPVNLTLSKTSVDEGTTTYEVNIGEKSLLLVGSTIPKKPQFDGIEMVILRFFNNSLYSMSVDDEKQGFRWKDGEEFSLVVSEKLGLPKTAWSIDGRRTFMTCKSFWIAGTAFEDGSSNLSLVNAIAWNAVRGPGRGSSRRALRDARFGPFRLAFGLRNSNPPSTGRRPRSR